MTYRVIFKPSALRELSELPVSVRGHIQSQIALLSENPIPTGSRNLKGLRDVYRLRAGSYRVLYHVDHSQGVVRILRVRHRRDVYRGL